MMSRLLIAALRLGLSDGGKMHDREIEPHVRHPIVLLDTFAGGVEEAEIVLGLRVTLVGGEAIPFGRFGMVLRNPVALGVHEPEAKPGGRIPLVGGKAKPSCRLGIVAPATPRPA